MKYVNFIRVNFLAASSGVYIQLCGDAYTMQFSTEDSPNSI